ncbi:MAG: amidase family protein [Candidatus Izemoplasma sp.]|nr:amidase family protein [Candidatus Izemoplasma sp.]
MSNFHDLSIEELQGLMREGKLTSYTLTMHFLNRIATIDQGEPRYNSILEVNPDALNQAQQRDYERGQNKDVGQLHGIPVILKDNISTLGKMHTTAGALAFKNHYASDDATLVKSLLKDGAVILGKANLTELANFMTLNNVNGYSSYGGYVRCPWDVKHDPSGSSTGSAVAASLRLAPVTIGTETSGSIISPSRTNGVIGLKPTIGLVSRTGIVPISTTLDTAGPIGNRVKDVATLLNSMMTADSEDPITLTKSIDKIDLSSLSKSLKSKTIGIHKKGYEDLSKESQKQFDHLVDTIQGLGAKIITDFELNEPKKLYNILLYEFKQCFNHYLNTEDMPVKSLHELITQNRAYSYDRLKYGQHLLEESEYNTSGRCNEVEYVEGLSERKTLQETLDNTFDNNHIDVILFANYTSLGPTCGFPSLTLPLGLDEDNMPIGSYFLAKRFNEQTLIEVTYAIEQALNVILDPLKK